MGDRTLRAQWISQRALEHVVLCLAATGLGLDRGRISLVVDPAADDCVLALCQASQSLSSALPRMGVVRGLSQSDGGPPQCAVRVRRKDRIAWQGSSCDLEIWLTFFRADALLI